MKNIAVIFLCLGIISSTFGQDKTTEEIPTDNQELIEIYNNDQGDRQTVDIDWEVVSKRDSLREVRIYELLEANMVLTANDYQRAAMVFQHGGDSTAYGMAVKLMRKSIELDENANPWLLAAAIDRYLLSKGEPQIYGTQYQKFGPDAPWQIGEIDTTKITDEERLAYGVETLDQQRETVKLMNKKQLSDLFGNDKTIDEIVTFINAENKSEAESEYDLSETGINSFGYQLLASEEVEPALKIFKLNTELFPNGFNTWDSYGECLLLLGRTEEGIKAYKKSLELEPGNQNAKMIIEQHK